MGWSFDGLGGIGRASSTPMQSHQWNDNQWNHTNKITSVRRHTVSKTILNLLLRLLIFSSNFSHKVSTFYFCQSYFLHFSITDYVDPVNVYLLDFAENNACRLAFVRLWVLYLAMRATDRPYFLLTSRLRSNRSFPQTHTNRSTSVLISLYPQWLHPLLRHRRL